MKIVDQSWEWVQKPPADALERIELIGRVAYKSEDRIKPGTARKFVKMILERGHETLIEHISATVKFVINRGTLLQITRHRLASFTGESTKFCRYDSGDMTFIRPSWWDEWSETARRTWLESMEIAEKNYIVLLNEGSKPEQAREILPNSLKVELNMTANLREWRHVFRLRASHYTHLQIRALMSGLLEEFKKEVPVVFDDIIAS